MPTISMIVAIDQNNAIGINNNMLCHLPNDLKYFKNVTQGHTVVMGRKTFESLPNGALPNRRNIVLSHQNGLKIRGCEVFSDIEDVKSACKDEDEIFIIGGGTIYNQYLTKSDKLYITHIHHSFDKADTYFPPIDPLIWKEEQRIYHSQDEKNPYPHSFVIYKKK